LELTVWVNCRNILDAAVFVFYFGSESGMQSKIFGMIVVFAVTVASGCGKTKADLPAAELTPVKFKAEEKTHLEIANEKKHPLALSQQEYLDRLVSISRASRSPKVPSEFDLNFVRLDAVSNAAVSQFFENLAQSTLSFDKNSKGDLVSVGVSKATGGEDQDTAIARTGRFEVIALLLAKITANEVDGNELGEWFNDVFKLPNSSSYLNRLGYRITVKNTVTTPGSGGILQVWIERDPDLQATITP